MCLCQCGAMGLGWAGPTHTTFLFFKTCTKLCQDGGGSMRADPITPKSPDFKVFLKASAPGGS